MKKDNRRSEIDNMPAPVLTPVGIAKMLSLMKGLNIIGDRVGDSKEEISAMVEPLIEFVERDYSCQAAHLERRGYQINHIPDLDIDLSDVLEGEIVDNEVISFHEKETDFVLEAAIAGDEELKLMVV